MTDPWQNFRPNQFLEKGDLSDVWAQSYATPLDVTGPTTDLVFTPPQMAQIVGGLENAFFYDNPPDTSAVIADATNKLPGWSLTSSGGSTANWNGTVGEGGGQILMTNGGSSGLVTLTQTRLVPDGIITGWVCDADAAVTSTATTTSFAKLSVQFLKADGTTTGAEGTDTATLTFINAIAGDTHVLRAVPNTAGLVPDDAVAVRVQLSLDANGQGGANTCAFVQSSLRFHGRWHGRADTSLPGTYTPNWEYQTNGYPYAISNGRWGTSMVGGFGVLYGPLSIGLDTTSTGAITLAAQYDSLVVPINVLAPMKMRSWLLRQGSSASARSSALRLYYDADGLGTALVFVTGSDATLSFTPAAVDNRTPNVSASGGVALMPGTYWAVVQNTHATNSFVVRNLAANDFAGSVAGHRTKAIGSAIGSTLAVTGWAGANDIPLVMLRGEAWGEGAAWT